MHDNTKIGNLSGKRIGAPSPLTSRVLLGWLEGRGIPAGLARAYLVQVPVIGRGTGPRALAVGFFTDHGLVYRFPEGWRGRVGGGVTAMDRDGARTREASCPDVVVLKSFVDLLSFLRLLGVQRPPFDVVVLNALSNAPRAVQYIREHRRAYCLLGRGRNAAECVRFLCDCLGDFPLVDISEDLLNPGEDLNDFLMCFLRERGPEGLPVRLFPWEP